MEKNGLVLLKKNQQKGQAKCFCNRIYSAEGGKTKLKAIYIYLEVIFNQQQS